MTHTVTASAISHNPRYVQIAMVVVCILGMAVFTSVAFTNIAVLGLVLVAPFAWQEFLKTKQVIEPDTKLFLGLVLALCVWDVCTNMLAGYGFGAALKELLHDMRTFGFILVLWAIFVNPRVAQIAFWAVCVTVLVLASINLFLTLLGLQAQGQYFTTGRLRMSYMSHMYGQALVGFVFVLAQMWLVKPSLSWRVGIPIALLVLSLFLASERRTGYVLLLAGFGLWVLLNVKRFCVGKYKWWLLLTALAVVIGAGSSNIVNNRMAQALAEVNEYLAMSPQERVSALGAVRIRMQYVNTVIEVIKQSNWWIGIGSLDLPVAYQAAAIKMGLEPETIAWSKYNWNNPHNEYIFMLATKGVIGLMLYLAVFGQACRVAWGKKDEVQRIGLIMFVFLFMLSVTTNSMMTDMEEGHFTMMILLIFMAPKSGGLFLTKATTKVNNE